MEVNPQAKSNKHVFTNTEESCKCEECGKVFRNQVRLKAHHYQQHELPRKRPPQAHACPVCNKLFQRKDLMVWHERTIHREEGKPHQCSLCVKRFARPVELAVHVRSHTGEKPFQCGQCTKSYHMKSMLNRHVKNAHGERRAMATCEICGASFTSTQGLKQHQRSHNRERPFLCSECPMRFMQSAHLRKHMIARHSQERPFTCDICNRKFAFKNSLENHRKFHKQGDFVCSVCKFDFGSTERLEKHQKIHTDSRPYSCNVCHKAFTRAVYLQKHKVAHLSEKPYKCMICNIGCNRMENLKRHIQRKHKDVPDPFVLEKRNVSVREKASQNKGFNETKCDSSDTSCEIHQVDSGGSSLQTFDVSSKLNTADNTYNVHVQESERSNVKATTSNARSKCACANISPTKGLRDGNFDNDTVLGLDEDSIDSAKPATEDAVCSDSFSVSNAAFMKNHQIDNNSHENVTENGEYEPLNVLLPFARSHYQNSHDGSSPAPTLRFLAGSENSHMFNTIMSHLHDVSNILDAYPALSRSQIVTVRDKCRQILDKCS